MKRLLLALLGLLVLSSGYVSCGSTQVKPDRERIEQRSKKAFQELEREEAGREE